MWDEIGKIFIVFGVGAMFTLITYVLTNKFETFLIAAAVLLVCLNMTVTLIKHPPKSVEEKTKSIKQNVQKIDKTIDSINKVGEYVYETEKKKEGLANWWDKVTFWDNKEKLKGEKRNE